MTTEIKLTDEQCDALGVERGSTLDDTTFHSSLYRIAPPKPNMPGHEHSQEENE